MIMPTISPPIIHIQMAIPFVIISSHFVAFCQKLIIYYTNATLFAFPAPGEDFGLVPAESLACGTPVVVWGDGAGPTEQITDGLNGFHAKPYDLKDFVNYKLFVYLKK